MFEEESEEYKNNTRIKDKNTYIGFPDEHISEVQDYEGNYIDISERIIKTFKDGAEFGYNKAKEEMQAQIEKLIDFVLSKIECCDVCPITDTCINSKGTCPYAGILAKGEEEVTREWLIQFISRR